MSWLFASGGQNIGASASGSVLLSPCSPRDSKEASPAPQFESINSAALSLLYSSVLTSIHDYWKIITLTIWTYAGKVISLLLNMLSRFVIAFLPRSKHVLISWLQSHSVVILEPKEIEFVTASTFFLLLAMK